MTLRLQPEQPKRSFVALAALNLAFFAILVTVYSVVLLRTHSVQAVPGFGAFLSGLAIAAVAVALGVLGLVLIWRSGRKGGVKAFVAIVLGVATLSGPAYVAGRGLTAPNLADVSTDLEDPPVFDRLARERGRSAAAVPPAEIPAGQAARQRAAYPDLKPLKLALPADDVAELAAGLAESRGWRIVGPTSYPRGGPPTGRIEAVARTPILGLDEDVSIRVRPEGDGARVDMRSASRVGLADFGGGAARVKSFLADLAVEANAAP